MKKAFLSAALALVAAGSWAFYPKAAEPGGYMMVVGSSYNNNISVITITSDGQHTEALTQLTKLKYLSQDKHKAELLKLNQLQQSGWRVVSMTATLVGNGYNTPETTYLLEKP